MIFRIIALILVVLGVSTNNVYAAFENNNHLKSIVIGEIGCYGKMNLKKEYLELFNDALLDALGKTNKYRIEYRENYIKNESDVRNASNFHMDCMFLTASVDRKTANVKLIKHFNTSNARGKLLSKDKYKISFIDEKYFNIFPDVNYILFINIEKFALKTDGFMDDFVLYGFDPINLGIALESDFYLVDKAKGTVNLGTIRFKKKANEESGITIPLFFIPMDFQKEKKYTLADVCKIALQTLAKNIAADISSMEGSKE